MSEINKTLPPRWDCSIASLIWDGLYVAVIGKLNLPDPSVTSIRFGFAFLST